MTVLIVEGDLWIRTRAAAILSVLEVAVVQAHELAETSVQVQYTSIPLGVFDVLLSDGAGLELLTELLDGSCHLPRSSCRPGPRSTRPVPWDGGLIS